MYVHRYGYDARLRCGALQATIAVQQQQEQQWTERTRFITSLEGHIGSFLFVYTLPRRFLDRRPTWVIGRTLFCSGCMHLYGHRFLRLFLSRAEKQFNTPIQIHFAFVGPRLSLSARRFTIVDLVASVAFSDMHAPSPTLALITNSLPRNPETHLPTDVSNFLLFRNFCNFPSSKS